MISNAITLAVDREHDLPVSPYVIGGAILLFFIIVMWLLFAFGKGRPHA